MNNEYTYNGANVAKAILAKLKSSDNDEDEFFSKMNYLLNDSNDSNIKQLLQLVNNENNNEEQVINECQKISFNEQQIQLLSQTLDLSVKSLETGELNLVNSFSITTQEDIDDKQQAEVNDISVETYEEEEDRVNNLEITEVDDIPTPEDQLIRSGLKPEDNSDGLLSSGIKKDSPENKAYYLVASLPLFDHVEILEKGEIQKPCFRNTCICFKDPREYEKYKKEIDEAKDLYSKALALRDDPKSNKELEEIKEKLKKANETLKKHTQDIQRQYDNKEQGAFDGHMVTRKDANGHPIYPENISATATLDLNTSGLGSDNGLRVEIALDNGKSVFLEMHFNDDGSPNLEDDLVFLTAKGHETVTLFDDPEKLKDPDLVVIGHDEKILNKLKGMKSINVNGVDVREKMVKNLEQKIERNKNKSKKKINNLSKISSDSKKFTNTIIPAKEKDKKIELRL